MRAQVGRHRYFWGTALTISLLHAIAAVAATREWVPIGSGGSVVALVIDPANPNRAFAAPPHGGVFRTDVAGGSWARASAGLPWREIEIFGLAVGESGPPRLYAATNAGVFVSKTAASSWEPTQLPSDGVHVLEVNPSDSNMVMLRRVRARESRSPVRCPRAVCALQRGRQQQPGKHLDIRFPLSYRPGARCREERRGRP